jgi:hypothetical protein
VRARSIVVVLTLLFRLFLDVRHPSGRAIA